MPVKSRNHNNKKKCVFNLCNYKKFLPKKTVLYYNIVVLLILKKFS